MNFSIIIPTYNRERMLIKHVSQAISELNEFNIEIIIINDNKNNPINQNIFPQYDKLFIYENPNKGVASARNYGALKATNEWLIFMDDDMQIFKNNLFSFRNHCYSMGKNCVNIEWEYPPDVMAKIRKDSFGRFLEKYGFTSMRGWNNFSNWPKNSIVNVKSIASANLLIRKIDFLETGGYDEKFPHAGFEDYVFSENLKKNGFNMFVDTTSIMYHNEEDRLILKQWLERKERDGETRKVSVELGFSEVKIHYSLIKKIIYSQHKLYLPFLSAITNIISGLEMFDYFSFNVYKFMLGTYIYKGYTKK